MKVKALFTKLAAFLAAAALTSGTFFGDVHFMMKTSALAEEETVPQAAEYDTGSENEGAESVSPEGGEAETQGAGAEEESGPQATEYDAGSMTPIFPEGGGAETQGAGAEEESGPQAAEYDAGSMTPIFPEGGGGAGSQGAEAEGKTDPQGAGTEESVSPESGEPDPQTPGAGEEPAPQAAESEAESTPRAAEPEEEPAPQATEPETETEDRPEDEVPAEPAGKEELVVIEDGPGSIAGEIAEQFDQPEQYEKKDFIGTAEITLVNDGMLEYGDEIVLKAVVRDVNVSFRLVWEANDNDDRGWYSVGRGEEYRFILDRDSAEREYRVVIIAVG